MLFLTLTVGPFQTNCYLVGDEKRGVAALVDPGDAAERVLRAVERSGLRLSHILLTHGHLDHIAAVGRVKEATGASVFIHPLDAEMLTEPDRNLSSLMGQRVVAPPADGLLEDGTETMVGGLRFQVLHTPGHTPGGVCFLVSEGAAGSDPNGAAGAAPGGGAKASLLLSGDTLFAGSIGRTDFPGGDMDQLLRSIRERLLVLPDDLPVYPGHGESTTIGEARQGNPFLS